jgi:hypothetical protein
VSEAFFVYSFLFRRNIWRIKKAVSCSFYSAAFYPLHHLSLSLARSLAEKQLGENLQHFISGGSAAEPLSAAERAQRERREMTICTSYFTLFNET